MNLDAPCPVTGSAIRVSTGSGDSGYDVSSPRDLDFVGFP
jgi:hypothetical protein